MHVPPPALPIAMHMAVHCTKHAIPSHAGPMHVPPEHVSPAPQSALVQHIAAHTQAPPCWLYPPEHVKSQAPAAVHVLVPFAGCGHGVHDTDCRHPDCGVLPTH